MSAVPVTFRRHFVPWSRPWLPQAAAWLARDWKRAGPLDLSDMLAVVPTRQSGRRLREALAEFAATQGTGALPPRIHTPDTLIAAGASSEGVATRTEARLAWSEVLRDVEAEAVSAVLPALPKRREFSWMWRVAGEFFRLQTQLAEGGLDFAGVARRVPADFPEAERWRQLAELERLQSAVLFGKARREPHAARRAGAQAAPLPPGIRRVVVLAVPDPLPALWEVLAGWGQSVPIDLVVFAPEDEAAAFDELGRPRPEIWSARPVELPEFESRVHICTDPAGEAKRVLAWAAATPNPDGLLAIGVADAEIVPVLERGLARADIAAYNPEGCPRKRRAFFPLLEAFAALVREPTFAAVAALARCPEFLRGRQRSGGETFSSAAFLGELDALHQRHLPADLRAALAAAGENQTQLRAGLHAVEEIAAALSRGKFPDNAIEALGLVLGDWQLQTSVPEEADLAETWEAWGEVMQECAAACEMFPEPSLADWWDLALEIFGELKHAPEKPPGALELQGWLELLWEDAPHLLIAGLNDGLVPDAIVGDAFLPESLRELLGLKTNAARFARDAYLLQALAHSRKSGGRLDLFFARSSAAGDPLRPSRLLLRCADDLLAARVGFLFRPPGPAGPSTPWTRAWQLRPRRLPPPARVRVTALRSWLECPFQFYLAHVLRMEPVDPFKAEMDARDFGTLCHAALEAMAREPALRDCTDETVLREFLAAELERTVRRTFGRRPALPVIVQLESARQRLAKAAMIQARERAAGWVLERVEWSFALDLGGLEVRGKIDRVERHEASGDLRVLDYKTSDTPVPPEKSHLRRARPTDEARARWLRTDDNDEAKVWTDLQLPLYLRALRSEFPGARVSCGYINLPKAAGDTALALWPELAGDLLAAADRCADGVAGEIRAGNFWPPASPAAEGEPFSALFHHGIEDSVVWEAPR